MSPTESCRICASVNLMEFLKRESVPVHQNLVVADQQAAKHMERGDLLMVACGDCGFVFNRTFDNGKLKYGEEYDNTQSHSTYFAEYLEELSNDLVSTKGIRNSQIVEVGCGKGDFLKMLVSNEELGNVGYGFDPSYNGPELEFNGRLRFARHNYDERCTDIAADVVVCRHVIEHVPAPLELLRTVRKALNESLHARIYFETPCVEWILRNGVIWDFFYEHCSLFSENSLATAFRIAGFRVDRVRRVFQDQYLWLEASIETGHPELQRIPGDVPRLASEFGRAEETLKNGWLKKLEQLDHAGKVAIWGAGAKGVTFANLIDPCCNRIDCVVDINPKKQDCYLPGTGHPVVGFHELAARGISHAILMNPNYREENVAMLQKAGITTQLVDSRV